MDIHQKALIACAEQLGIKVEYLQQSWHIDAIRLHHGNRSTLVLYGRIFAHLNYIANAIAENKMAAKGLMIELGIPVPDSYSFSVDQLDINRLKAFHQQYPWLVAKPLKGTDGKGIAMHLNNIKQTLEHIKQFSAPNDHLLLEQQVIGEDLRLQYLSGRIIAACIRKPCTLLGDGQSTIIDLIQQRNCLIQSQNPENFIHLDQQVHRRLADTKMTLKTILPNSQALQIKDVSNMAQGGHAIDVTEQVHPRYQDYLDALADNLHIKLFSLDVMTTSPASDPKQHAYVLEFNAQSAWLHHTFSEVQQHDIAKLILEDYFELGDK